MDVGRSAFARLFQPRHPFAPSITILLIAWTRAPSSSTPDTPPISPDEEMLREATGCYPALANKLSSDGLPNLSHVDDASCDGILCWAVLLHLPEEFLFDAVFNLRRILKPGGRLLISTPLVGPATGPETHRDAD